MKITIQFGSNGNNQKQINWWQPLLSFPHLLSYSGKKWEWVMYAEDPAKFSDYVIHLSELPTYDPNFYADMVSFESLFNSDLKCECGAAWSGFEWDHMFFCKLWKPWK